MRLALLREQQGRREEAMGILQNLLEENPMDAPARRALDALRAARPGGGGR